MPHGQLRLVLTFRLQYLKIHWRAHCRAGTNPPCALSMDGKMMQWNTILSPPMKCTSFVSSLAPVIGPLIGEFFGGRDVTNRRIKPYIQHFAFGAGQRNFNSPVAVTGHGTALQPAVEPALLLAVYIILPFGMPFNDPFLSARVRSSATENTSALFFSSREPHRPQGTVD